MTQSWMGQWAVIDGDGSHFIITLNSDGSATSSYGEGEEGSWEDGGNQATASWTNGWIDHLERHGDGYRKVASRSDGTEPDNTSSATRVG